MKLSNFNSLLALGALLATSPTLARPMDPQLARHYAELERRQGPLSIVEIAGGIFLYIIEEGIGSTALGDIANAIATALNPGGPKAPWVSENILGPP